MKSRKNTRNAGVEVIKYFIFMCFNIGIMFAFIGAALKGSLAGGLIVGAIVAVVCIILHVKILNLLGESLEDSNKNS